MTRKGNLYHVLDLVTEMRWKRRAERKKRCRIARISLLCKGIGMAFSKLKPVGVEGIEDTIANDD